LRKEIDYISESITIQDIIQKDIKLLF